jgi:hypothetical protein
MASGLQIDMTRSIQGLIAMPQYLIKSTLNLGLAALMLTGASAAEAVAIFSNFGASHSYDTSAGLPVGNAFTGDNYAQAAAFTPSANARMGSLLIALSDVFGQTDPITVALTQTSGGIPGPVVESFTIAGNTLGPLGNNNVPILLTSLLHPLLNAGTQYWITVSTSFNNAVAWNFNNTGDLDHDVEAQSLDGGSTWALPFGNTRGAFEVASVPEPDSLALLGSGGLLLVRSRRGRAATG